MIWRAGKFELVFPRGAAVMGIINVTPDSFSDGGHFLETNAAVDHAYRLMGEGAAILDIGGESTRPNADPVSEAEELRRVIPVIERLRGIPIPISIDTYKPAVARAAAEAGASIVNDVGAGGDRNEMWQVIAQRQLGYIAMHTRGTPRTMQAHADYDNVTAEVAGFFGKRLVELRLAGVSSEQVVLDPGLGFAKTLSHNLELLRDLRTFLILARPLLLGISRKSFIARLLGPGTEDRLAGSLAGAVWAVQNGAHLIRAHDVGPTVQALRMIEAISGANQQWSG